MTVNIGTTANIDQARFKQETAHPASPASGYELLYVISGSPHGGLFVQDSAGRQIGPFITGTSGGSSTSLVSDRKYFISGTVTTTSTSFVDMSANLSITLTTGARRCRITFSGAGASNANSTVAVDVNIDGTRMGQDLGLLFAQGSTHHNFSFSIITPVLSAGSHTFKPQWKVDANQGSMYATSTLSPIVFSVDELPLKDPS